VHLSRSATFDITPSLNGSVWIVLDLKFLVDKTTKNRVFYGVFLCCLVEICQRLEIICFLHIWGRQNGRYNSHYILHSSTLKMCKTGHSATLVSLCNIAQRQVSEDSKFLRFALLIHSIFNCIFYVVCFGWNCECYRNLVGSIYKYFPWWHLTVQELLVIYIQGVPKNVYTF
jgi:hypothetical protein